MGTSPKQSDPVRALLPGPAFAINARMLPCRWNVASLRFELLRNGYRA